MLRGCERLWIWSCEFTLSASECFVPALILCLWKKLLTSLDNEFLYCVEDKCKLPKTTVLKDYLKYCTNNSSVTQVFSLLPVMLVYLPFASQEPTCMQQTVGLSAPSASLQMTSSWVMWLMCLKEGMPPEGPGQAWEVGPCEPHEVQQGQVQSPAPGLGQPLVSVWAGGWRDWEQLCRKGLGGTGGWKAGCETTLCTHNPEGQLYPRLHQKKHGQQVKGGDSVPLLCSGETTLGFLHWALEPSLQQRHGPVGTGPEESVLGLSGVGLVFTRGHSQDSWPKLAKQTGYLKACDVMLSFSVGELARGRVIAV